jgi:hypothetical protein
MFPQVTGAGGDAVTTWSVFVARVGIPARAL